MGFSINVNWSEEFERWDNIGRNLRSEKCKCDEGVDYKGYCEECEIYEDDNQPMMNYAYPLETTPDNDSVLEVCEKTACTVMYNNDEDSYYIALCGGGMDFSQDIALAYIILERWIPMELALSVCTQDGWTRSGKNFRRIMRGCKESIEMNMSQGKSKVKRIKEAIKDSLTNSRERREAEKKENKSI